MELGKLPVETLEYRHTFVYAVPSGFGSEEDGFKELVYIPAVESWVLNDLSEHQCNFEIMREKYPSDPRVKTLEETINKWIKSLSELLIKTTARDECRIVPNVLKLPEIKKGEKNLRSVWECRVWPPCVTKHEAWHVAMSLCDIQIRKLKMGNGVEKLPEPNAK